MIPQLSSFWSIDFNKLLSQLNSSPQGLSEKEAQQRLAEYGSNLLKPKKRSDIFTLLIAQFKSPIILILLFAVALSFFVHDPIDALIILAIVLISGILGLWQEKGAANAVEKLLALVQIRSSVLRDNIAKEIPVENIVPGDIVILNAGDVIPSDSIILEAKDLFIDEATLTGETFPVEKSPGTFPKDTPLNQRLNVLWMGTHVVSGSAKALVIQTGKLTEFGKVSERLKLRPQETEFEHGVRKFGYLLMEVTLVLVIAIFAINVYLSRPVLDSFLFSLALAVGLTPQLLPAIISINLSHGAKRMAQEKVIVKRLASIENFGSMNIMCSDKTGTLTEGTVNIQSALDFEGASSEKVLLLAYLNAYYETGFVNPIDQAIRAYQQFDVSGYEKTDEIPYDFIRKRLSIVLLHEDKHIMVTKGALANVLEVCTNAETAEGKVMPLGQAIDKINKHFEKFSAQGYRVLGIAYKHAHEGPIVSRDHETDMTFAGFLVLFDPPKPEIANTITKLKQLGVSLKIITGDNHLVAMTVGDQMGLSHIKISTGPALKQMDDAALVRHVMDTDIFAEIEPNQKERIILAYRKAGNVVGFMGDGINDASALHASDVGISVDSAVDVAKEAADIVLLEKNLSVLIEGVKEGRKTFANTLKYVFMATSANFGNMFSMAGVSLIVSFLPLLPKQILLTNLMTDFPEMTIATDSVDKEMEEAPRRWNIKAIRKFMITFGLLSSIFDYMTFGALLLLLRSSPDEFRTGWFLESVVSASMIVLVIRSRKPFYKSKPGKYLLMATLIIILVTLALPYTPLAILFNFIPLPLSFLLMLAGILVLYVITAETAKYLFYRRVEI